MGLSTQPNMGLTAALFGLTWAYQHRLSAKHGLIRTTYQPYMGLSAALVSQHGPISNATQPKKGLSAPPFSLTWTYKHSLTG